MKTYKKEIALPRLVIEHDSDAESPRTNDNIGYFFTKENRYKSPDLVMHELYDIMIATADEAENTEDHIKRMKAAASKAFKESAPKDGNSHDEDLHVIDIYPVYKYEHSGIAYKRGVAGGFDYSNCGFYFITAQSISGETQTDESIQKRIDAELEEYTQWCNGEVYCFTLYDKAGEIVESMGGFYDIEDIRACLPKEWEKEKLEDYIK